MVQHPYCALFLLAFVALACTSRGEPIELPTTPVLTTTPSVEPLTGSTKEHKASERSKFEVILDEAEALCTLGHGERCVRLGIAYGKPPVEDLLKAAARFSRACDLGEAPGCLELGEALLAGRGVAADRTEAISKIGQACELGLVAACMHGALESISPEEMLKVAERNCTHGDASACMKAGDMLLRDADTSKDVARAVRYLKRACEAGTKRACQAIAKIYEVGIGAKIDEKRALALYRRYCASGDLDSCCYLGQLAAEGRIRPRDPVQALAEWDSTCTRGSMTCCLNAGVILSDGTLLPVDPPRALAYLQRACDGGEPDGCAALGDRLEHGIAGVGGDTKKAAAAFIRACELRHFRSCERALEMQSSATVKSPPP